MNAFQPSAEETRLCPLCRKPILKLARKCKHCKQTIPPEVDIPFVRERLRMKEQALSASPPRRVPFLVGFKVRIGTMVAAAIAIFFALMIYAGISMQDRGWELTVIGVGGFTVTTIILVLRLAIDIRIPSAGSRNTPALGLAAFLLALKTGRFRYAYACLLDGDKDGTVRTRPGFQTVEVQVGVFAFATLEGFRGYWQGVMHSSMDMTRTANIKDVRILDAKDDFAVVSAEVEIRAYPAWVGHTMHGSLLAPLILAIRLTKRETVRMTKLMRCVHQQWYVVNGEIDSLEDYAIKEASQIAHGTAAR